MAARETPRLRLTPGEHSAAQRESVLVSDTSRFTSPRDQGDSYDHARARTAILLQPEDRLLEHDEEHAETQAYLALGKLIPQQPPVSSRFLSVLGRTTRTRERGQLNERSCPVLASAI